MRSRRLPQHPCWSSLSCKKDYLGVDFFPEYREIPPYSLTKTLQDSILIFELWQKYPPVACGDIPLTKGDKR